MALALASGLLCGIVPALRASTVSVVGDVQRAGSRAITGRLWLRHAFVVGQVAACVVLLVVSSLFLRSLIRITSLNPGFDLDHGLVATFYLEPNRTPGRAPRCSPSACVNAWTESPACDPAAWPASCRWPATEVPVASRSGAGPDQECTHIPQQCRSPLL